MAEVNFHRAMVRIDLIVHEFFHAAICWGRKVRFDWTRFDSDGESEEFFAYIQSCMVTQFLTQAQARGLL